MKRHSVGCEAKLNVKFWGQKGRLTMIALLVSRVTCYQAIADRDLHIALVHLYSVFRYKMKNRHIEFHGLEYRFKQFFTQQKDNFSVVMPSSSLTKYLFPIRAPYFLTINAILIYFSNTQIFSSISFLYVLYTLPRSTSFLYNQTTLGKVMACPSLVVCGDVRDDQHKSPDDHRGHRVKSVSSRQLLLRASELVLILLRPGKEI